MDLILIRIYYYWWFLDGSIEVVGLEVIYWLIVIVFCWYIFLLVECVLWLIDKKYFVDLNIDWNVVCMKCNIFLIYFKGEFLNLCEGFE